MSTCLNPTYGDRCYQHDCFRCSELRRLVQVRWKRAGGSGLCSPIVLCVDQATQFTIRHPARFGSGVLTTDSERLGDGAGYWSAILTINWENVVTKDLFIAIAAPSKLSQREMSTLLAGHGYELWLQENFIGSLGDAIDGDRVIVGPCVDVDAFDCPMPQLTHDEIDEIRVRDL